MQKHGIKEILELLDGVEVLAVAAAKVLKDGKVGVEDLSILATLAMQSGKLIDAYDGLAAVVQEGQEIDELEAKEIIAKLYAGAAKVAAAKL